jgi:hypothetical protein
MTTRPTPPETVMSGVSYGLAEAAPLSAESFTDGAAAATEWAATAAIVSGNNAMRRFVYRDEAVRAADQRV